MGGFDFMFSVVPIFMFVFFGTVFSIVIFTIIKSFKHAAINNKMPVVTSDAVVLTKRTAVRGEHAHTTYYVTFELDNRSRFELQVPDFEYGMLAENDAGKLCFQGTKYIGFVRNGYSYDKNGNNDFSNHSIDTKKCPYCMSISKSNAVKCDSCGAGL